MNAHAHFSLYTNGNDLLATGLTEEEGVRLVSASADPVKLIDVLKGERVAESAGWRNDS